MKRRLGHILLLSFFFTPALVAQAQTEEDRRSPGPGLVAVTYDLSNGELDAALPFDVSFDLVVKDRSRTVRAIAVSLFEAEQPFQVAACGPTSNPSCPKESWRCIAERRLGTKAQDVWEIGHRPGDSTVNCSFTPDVALLAPVQQSTATEAQTFHLPLPPLRANREYQILLRFVPKQDPLDIRLQAILAEFRNRAPLTIEQHLSTLDPLTADQGAFRQFAQGLLADLQGAARSRGLELIADPKDRLLQTLGAAGNLPVEEDLIQVLKREVPGLLTERLRLPGLKTQCSGQLSSMNASLGSVLNAIDGARDATGKLPDDLVKKIQSANLSPLLESGAQNQIAAISRAQVSDPCAEIDSSILTGASAAYAVLQGNLRDLVKALPQPQPPPLTSLAQAATTAANDAFNLMDSTRRIAGARTRFDQMVTNLVTTLTQAAVQDRIIFARASTIGTFESRQKWQIAGDFGFAYGWEIGEAAPYIGTNFYFRPVNKQAPLRDINPLRQPLRRLSATVGVVLTDIGDGRTRDPLIDTGKISLLAGGGYRFTDAVRLSVGVMIFRKRDPNPLINDNSLATSPYTSLSLDWDLQNLVAWFGRVFRPG